MLNTLPLKQFEPILKYVNLVNNPILDGIDPTHNNIVFKFCKKLTPPMMQNVPEIQLWPINISSKLINELIEVDNVPKYKSD